MSEPYLPLRSQLNDERTGFVARAWALWFQFFAQTVTGDPKGAFVKWGTGSPETVVTAPIGSLYLRTNGGASTTLYVKESGTGNVGWRAV